MNAERIIFMLFEFYLLDLWHIFGTSFKILNTYNVKDLQLFKYLSKL